MVHESIIQCIGHTPLVYFRRLFAGSGVDVIGKLEMLNPGGSIKDRPARYIIEQGLREGTINADTHLIESSSGNFGIAIATIARIYNLTFTCVVDPKISPTNLRILLQLGAHVEMVDKLDQHNGYLHTRVQRVQELLNVHPGSVWLNQYANKMNWEAHYFGTGQEILDDLDAPIDCLVTAVSTSGTILGVARQLRQAFPRLRVIAVDAEGSVIFGGPAKPRSLPGIGSSRVPEILRPEEIDEVIYVNDWEAVQGCHALMSHEGIFAGGSSGAVIAATQKLLPYLPRPYRILTLLPDRGERYMDTVYNEAWVDLLETNNEQPLSHEYALDLHLSGVNV